MYISDLTKGSVKAMHNNEEGLTPVLQVIDVKKISSSSAAKPQDRYRLVISDGEFYQQAMLTTQLNERVTNGSLVKFCCVRLDGYICNTVQNRRIVIILNLEVVSPALDGRLGDPQNVEQASSTDAVKSEPTSAPQLQRSATTNRPPVARDDSNPNIYPISSLNQYQNRWTIRARVTRRSDIRHWKNQKGEGKLFSIDLLDDQGGEIRATFFNDAVDKFHDLLAPNHVFTFSKGNLKIADKRFTSLKCDYEITFDSNAQILECQEEVNIPKMTFNFMAIDKIESQTQKDQIIDVIGVVSRIGDLTTIVARTTGNEIPKRNVTIRDKEASVEVTLWGSTANNFNHEGNPVIVFKGTRVSDYGGRTLSTIGSTFIEVNPDIPEAYELRSWFDSEGQTAAVKSISTMGGGGGGSMNGPRKLLSQVKDENLGMEKTDYFVTKAAVTFIPEKTLYYPACPSADCNKKVISEGEGQFWCEKCQKSYPNCENRYVMGMSTNDHTGNVWMSAFNDMGKEILGHTADELSMWKDNDEQQYAAVIRAAHFKSYIMKCRAKSEIYQDENRVKVHILNAVPVDYVTETKEMLGDVKKLIGAC